MKENTAQRAVAFTASGCRDAAMRHAGLRSFGGKTRSVLGRVVGYRFDDGSAVTVDDDGYAVEFLGTFARERGELDGACEAARVLAAATLAGERPFLGMLGARDVLARTYDGFSARVGGYAYLDAVKAGMVGGKVYTDTDTDNMIDQSRRVQVSHA